ncbi:ubiquitin carboxyl-terminal hydrolase Usp2 isoform X2 [Eurosta solidaginis]|uniref:ubiquitin carboxyl-terminal hydrolase Usp2 isoform X2 n=1 Tax=Eurosta solidaginis TaxID=178769 RepID=UPI003530D023
MIDITKRRNNSIEKLSFLKQKCEPVVISAQQQTNLNANNIHKAAAVTITTKAWKSANITERNITTKNNLKLSTAAATITKTVNSNNAQLTNGRAATAAGAAKTSPKAGRRAVSVGSAPNAKTSNSNNNNKQNNSSNKTNSKIRNNIGNDAGTNPVRAANKIFFLLPQFQDQSFLKEECELAHAQATNKVPAGLNAQKRQQKKSSGDKAVSAANASRGVEFNNNNHTIISYNRSSQVRHNSASECSGGSNNNYNTANKNPAVNGNIGTGYRRATTTATPATVAALTTNGMRRSAGGSVNVTQQHASPAATKTTASTAGSSQKGANSIDSTVRELDIVFNNQLQYATENGERFVANKSQKQPQQHSFSGTRPLAGTTLIATTIVNTRTTTTVGSGKATTTATVSAATKLSNGHSKLVRPQVHRTIPSTAVTAVNATRDNVNAYSNKLFNSYGSNINRFNNINNNNNNNNNNNGLNRNNLGNVNAIVAGLTNNNISSNNTGGGSAVVGSTDVNGMQQTLEHDDIKYIDSDDAPTTAARSSASPATTTTAVSGGSGVGSGGDGGQIVRRTTQLRCEQLHCQRNNKALHATATATHSKAVSGGVDSSAPFKARTRPKSTIICSTSNLVFEKINNYKYANGSAGAGGGSSAAKIAAEAVAARRQELRHSIDSNSIRASIQKFDSFSEQKRSGIGAAAQVVMRSHGGSGSTSNLQHHRHSGSEFDHSHGSGSLLRLAQGGGGGGSLTRAPYRTASPSPVSTYKVTTTMHVPSSLAACSRGSSSSSIRTLHSSSGASSTNSLPTKSAGSIIATNSTAINTKRHQEVSLLRTSERPTSALLLQNEASPSAPPTPPNHTVDNTKLLNGVSKCTNAEPTMTTVTTNGVCAAVSGEMESIRSTALRSIPPPPPSPTSSRYWDRDSRTTPSALNNFDDTSKFKSNDENSEGLCGLRNIGNTCFMNSVIQCLSNTSELTKFLKQYNGTRSSSSKDQQILQEFAKLIREMWSSNVHSVTPMDLKRAFSLKHRMYSDYNQQDAQEFLRFFLDSLHSALNTGVKGEHLKIDDNLSDNKKADLTWEWYSRHENSLIRDLFVGQLKSTLRCTSCGNTSVTFDPFWDLSVSLPSSSRCKLESCLDLFIREEVLDGDEMPTCSKCRQRRRCTKSFSIQRFPKYLVIHLKRFSETRWSKLSNIVEFPTSERELNMGPYGSNPNMNIYYSLYAISNHMGSTAGGHYVALCKHPVSRKWHEFNDNIVSDTLSENNLVSSSAYILFYERA